MPKKTKAKKVGPVGKVKGRLKGYLAEGRARANQYLSARPHRSFKPTPRERYKKGRRVEKLWPLIIGTFKLIWKEKRLLGGLLLLFALTTFLFVGGVVQSQFTGLRDTLRDLFSGNIGEFGTATSLFTTVVTGGLNSAVGQVQQYLAGFITAIFWLAIVWVLRRRLKDEPTSIREALYNCGAPIVPTIILLIVIFVQLIPAALGIFGAGLVLLGMWVQGGVESMMIAAAAALMCLISFYWISASFMSLIIVTLPGMTPWRAHNAASTLVIGQRWRIVLRLTALVPVILVTWAAVLVPLLLIDSWLRFDWLPLVPFVAQLLSAFTVVYCSTYIYRMYRSML